MRPVSRLLAHGGLQSLMIMAMRGISMVAKLALTLFMARFMGLDALGTYGLIAGSALFGSTVFGFGMILCISRSAVTATSGELTEMLRPALAAIGVVYLSLLVPAAAIGTWLGAPFLALAIWLIVFLEHLNGSVVTLLNHLRKPLTANILFSVGAGAWILAFVPLAYWFPGIRTMPALLGFWIAGQGLALIGAVGTARGWDWQASVGKLHLWSWFRRQFAESRTLYANAITNTAAQYIDRFLIGAFLGLELTGVYVLFWSLGNALANLVRMGLIAVARPNLVAAHKNKQPDFWPLVWQIRKRVVLSSVALGASHYTQLPVCG